MNIAIDFDKTWTRDPWFWRNFSLTCKLNNYKLYIVTRRSANDELQRLDNDIDDEPIIYCNGEFKRLHCERLGIKIDIWIDDEPGTIEPQRLPNPCPDSLL